MLMLRIVGDVEPVLIAVRSALTEGCTMTELSRNAPQMLDVPPGADGIVVAFNAKVNAV